MQLRNDKVDKSCNYALGKILHLRIWTNLAITQWHSIRNNDQQEKNNKIRNKQVSLMQEKNKRKRARTDREAVR